MRRRLALLLGSLSALSTACDSIPFLAGAKKKKKKKKKDADAEEEAVAEETAAGPAPSVPPAPRGPVIIDDLPDKPRPRSDAGFLDKAADVGPACVEELGKGARLLSVSVHPDYAVIVIRDPDVPGAKKHLKYKGGGFRDMGFKSGVKAKPEELQKEEFSVDEVRWTELPKVMADAVKRAKISPGELTQLNIGRSVVGHAVEIHYFFKSGSASGRVDYSAHGKFLDQYENR